MSVEKHNDCEIVNGEAKREKRFQLHGNGLCNAIQIKTF